MCDAPQIPRQQPRSEVDVLREQVARLEHKLRNAEEIERRKLGYRVRCKILELANLDEDTERVRELLGAWALDLENNPTRVTPSPRSEPHSCDPQAPEVEGTCEDDGST